MLITLPASAHGSPDPASVLDLEPFLEFRATAARTPSA